MIYYTKIKVNKDPQILRIEKEIILSNELLTLEKLSKYVTKDDQFAIDTQEARYGEPTNVLTVFTERLETNEEIAIRVDKEEKYNENYRAFHAKRLVIIT